LKQKCILQPVLEARHLPDVHPRNIYYAPTGYWMLFQASSKISLLTKLVLSNPMRQGAGALQDASRSSDIIGKRGQRPGMRRLDGADSQRGLAFNGKPVQLVSSMIKTVN